MTYTEVLELIRAGYTKDEIAALMETKQTEVSEDAPKEEPKQTEVSKEEPKESESEKLAKALGLKLDALTKAIQVSNVNTIEHPGITETADDIIAKLINPYTNGKED